MYDQCVEAIQGYPLGYRSPPLLEALNRGSLGPSLPPTTLRVVIPTKSLLVYRQSPVSHSYTVDDQRLQIATVQI